MNAFITELKRNLSCEILCDTLSKVLYSTDASIYEIEPTCIVIPRTKDELQQTIKIAYAHKVPIIPRGAGTGITGGCLGKGVVIDTSKHLNRILEISSTSARVEPGVIQDDLNQEAFFYGVRLGPDTSTGNRATIGGMLANNAAGAYSVRYGKMQEHIIEAELILYDGTIVHLKPIKKEDLIKQTGPLARIYTSLYRISSEYGADIKAHFPKLLRRASGYALNELIEDPIINPARLLAGSEGTLGFVSEITLSLSPLPGHRTLIVIEALHLFEALDDIHSLLKFEPFSLELIDDKIIRASNQSKSLSFLNPISDALIVLEIEDEDLNRLKERVKKIDEYLAHKSYVKQKASICDPLEQAQIWNIRKQGLGLLLSSRSYIRAIAFIEDIAVPPESVSIFLRALREILLKYNKTAGIYGHLGPGCLHIRPYIDTRSDKDLSKMLSIMNEVMALVKECGGVLSGEHGDGLVRSWTTEIMFGKKLTDAFIQLKTAFDPERLMNPGKIVPPTQGLQDNLRLQKSPPQDVLNTFLDFSYEGGLALSTDLCNGNGECRKKEGVMCPSFQVTKEEKDATRGRAHALRALMWEEVPKETLYTDEFYDILDLCLMCKGCKTECPSGVDMAKMKSEYLYQYHSQKGFSLRSKLFGHISTFFQLGSYFPTLSNFLSNTRPIKALLNSIGISKDRSLPKLAKTRCTKLLPNKKQDSFDVVLFIDTFTEFVNPEVGTSAFEVLTRMGFRVAVAKRTCCGRTLFSKGMLKSAKNKIETLIEILHPYASQGIPIIGLEPSCLLMFRDEFKDFSLDPYKVEAIANASFLFDEFIERHIDRLQPHIIPSNDRILIHTHCHQKSALKTDPTLSVLKACHLNCQEIPSGCCGMAGSFGYEKEHYSLSNKIAELILFPSISKEEKAHIVSNGISCRTQILDGLHTPSLHLAELLKKLLK